MPAQRACDDASHHTGDDASHRTGDGDNKARSPAIECTHFLLRWRAKTDSVLGSAFGGSDAGGDRTGAIWRSPPGKRGVSLHEALVRGPCSCIRRLAGNRAREVQFTRFLRNKKVGVAEMAGHAAARTADRVAG